MFLIFKRRLFVILILFFSIKFILILLIGLFFLYLENKNNILLKNLYSQINLVLNKFAKKLS